MLFIYFVSYTPQRLKLFSRVSTENRQIISRVSTENRQIISQVSTKIDQKKQAANCERPEVTGIWFAGSARNNLVHAEYAE